MSFKISLNEEIVAEYDAVVQEAQTMTFLARASDLQEAAARKIDAFLLRLADCKGAYVRASDECRANHVLAMELALRAVRAELSMWLKLKREDPGGAWDDLVTAQESLGAASAVRRQVEADATGLENLLRKLVFVECWVFPPQMFSSIGGTVSRRACSICGGEYDDCDHIRGRAYMGRMCYPIIQEFTQLNEISIVNNPADKRCRITHFSDEGKMRNKMTWRIEDRPGAAERRGGANGEH